MKNKFRILFSLIFLFFTTQSFSSPIQKINFIGLNNNSEESLLKIIPFQVGQELNDTSSNLIIESLFKTGLFADINISKTQDNLNITLKENPTVRYFDFDLNYLDRNLMVILIILIMIFYTLTVVFPELFFIST